MERVLQYLDNLDDWYYSALLCWERARRVLLRLAALVALGSAGSAAMLAAALLPPAVPAVDAAPPVTPFTLVAGWMTALVAVYRNRGGPTGRAAR